MRSVVLLLVACRLCFPAIAWELVYLPEDPLIDGVAYDVDERTLAVFFAGGEACVFRAVPPDVAGRLLGSSAPVETYWAEIEGRYTMQRITGRNESRTRPATSPPDSSRDGAGSGREES